MQQNICSLGLEGILCGRRSQVKVPWGKPSVITAAMVTVLDSIKTEPSPNFHFSNTLCTTGSGVLGRSW